MERQWFVLMGNNEQRGPFTADEVRGLISSGQVGASNYCWAEGMANWAPLGQVSDFAADLKTAEAPGGQQAGGSEAWDTISRAFGRLKRGVVSTANVAKLKMRVSKLKSTREGLCTALGAEVYQCREQLALTESMQKKCQEISNCDTEIASVEEQIAQIKTDAKQE
jgi:hypothetical protein